MKKVAFIMLHLGFGGAERAVISEANLLCEFCEVEIISFYKLYEKPAFEVDDRVKITYLTEGLKPNRDEVVAAIQAKNPFAVLREGLKSLKILHLRKSLMQKAIRNCDADVIISSRYIYHRLLTKNAKKGVVCIAQEHNHHNGNEKYIKEQISAVRDMDYFMPVSRELTDFYAKKVGKGVDCKYIPHHLEVLPEKASDLTAKSLLAVGRFAPEKDFPELIRIFAEINSLHPDWKLNLVGDGDEMPKIKALVAELGLENSVILHGFKTSDEIAKISLDSSIYVMTSLTESFGLVLIEAMSFGIPCIAYSSARGATEIITDSKDGFIIENRSRVDMVKAIDRLITDLDLRREMGANALKKSDSFSKNQVASLWKALLEI